MQVHRKQENTGTKVHVRDRAACWKSAVSNIWHLLAAIVLSHTHLPLVS